MRKLLETWKKNVLLEQVAFPYQIYCDMDGVLVDFVNGAVDRINQELDQLAEEGKRHKRLVVSLEKRGRKHIKPEDISQTSPERIQIARKYMYELLANNTKFWGELPWMDDGQKLWSYVGQYNPYILTTPMEAGSEKGKEAWIRKNLSPLPVKIYMSDKKYEYAIGKDGKPNVLIDDFMENTGPWIDHGGIAILHKSTDETIQKLQELQKNGRIT